MKKFKSLLSVIIALVIITGMAALPATVSAATDTKSKTMQAYTDIYLGASKPKSETYKCIVSGNEKNYIEVDFGDYESKYYLNVTAKKVTANTKPVVTIYSDNNGTKTTVKRYKFTVTKAKTRKFSEIKVNYKTTKNVTLINPFVKEYKFKFSKKIANFEPYYASGDKVQYPVKGLKKGAATVKVYIKGTNTKVGSFKITVGNFPTKIKKKYSTLNLNYNSHGHVKGNCIKLDEMLKDVHANAKYSVKIKNDKIAGSEKIKKSSWAPNENAFIYSKAKGKTTATVYEKIGSAKKTKIGTFTIKVNGVKMAKVMEYNRELDNDGIFYENFISPGETYDLKSEIVKRYINCEDSGSKFKKSEYKFTFKSNHPEILSVDENGIITCNALDSEGVSRITYTVTFSDGSKYTASGAPDVWPVGEKPI